jgi:hypothetical protein
MTLLQSARLRRIFLYTGCLWVAMALHGAERNGRSPLEASVVTLEATAKVYDYFQPWNKPTRTVRKHALVIGDRELVTTAQNLADLTLVRVQKGGRGRWFNAELRWIDYHANLAVVAVESDAFWDGLQPATLAPGVPWKTDYDIIRWRDGNLETRRAAFSKFTVSEGVLSFAPRIYLELNTEIDGLGWSEPVMAESQIVGLTVSKGGDVCSVMPMPFVTRILQARKAGHFPGLGYFDFVWQQSENPATLEHLELEGDPRGAIVIEIPKNAGGEYALERLDVLLEIDGFEVDMQGDYNDPDYGHVMMEGLATRRHFAGDEIPMKVLRDGEMMDLKFRLPKASYSVDLLPMHVFDHEPEYLVAGGLIFQPLHQGFLRGWGDDWRRRAPFRLSYYIGDQPTPERPSLLLLSQVLPDPVNIGYQEFRNLVVDTVNGLPVHDVAGLDRALEQPRDGVHRIEFVKGEGLQRLVLDAEQIGAATRRVLQRYGIPSSRVIHPPGDSLSPGG